MKLILKEYLASLRERKELDALLPDLLSQMGLEVYSRPSVGTRQYGVDIAAVGSLNGQEEKVYLFSVKSGDLGRKDWNGGAVQDLQPSLDEIIGVYIPTHLPDEHRSKPIEICICFGGDIKEAVRLNISQYEKKNGTDAIKFVEWGGDRLASLVEQYLLKEELLPKEFRHLLRKSLALLDEPEVSYRHFSHLMMLLLEKKDKDCDVLTGLRQLNICLWILFSWCREAKNLESAYLVGELSLLHAWDSAKPYLAKKPKVAKNILITLDSIQSIYQTISRQFLDYIIVPYTGKKHALSSAVNPSCSVDVNLKLFDILSRLALGGLWAFWQEDQHQYVKYAESLKELISNNPILFSPYKDDQAIDISIAVFLLALDYQDRSSIKTYLSEMILSIRFNFDSRSSYTCNLNSYSELIEHPLDTSNSYQKEVTAGSILYPYITLMSALFDFDDIYKEVQDFKKESLQHCNFQFWYVDKTSEENFYTNKDLHGATLSHIEVAKPQEEFLDHAFKECKEAPYFDDLSVVKHRVWPIIFLACRHYRVPLPIDFFQELRRTDEE